MDGDAYIGLPQQCSAVQCITLTGCTATSMHEQFGCLWEVEVDNIVQQGHVKAACC